MSDAIEKTIDLNAPIDRVWRALTDHTEFGEWFRVKLDHPFVVGETAEGQILHPGFEHVRWTAKVVAMDKPDLFAFTWHPYGVDKTIDYSKETPTRVEFRLKSKGEGTHLTIVESGFDAVPAYRRDEALRMNDRGWTQQILNIKSHAER